MKEYIKFVFRNLQERDKQLKSFDRIGAYIYKIDEKDPLVVWVRV